MPKNGALSRQVRAKGDVVPLPWPSLADVVKPRPGFLVVFLGAPGVGKSTVGVNWAYSLDKPALLVSLDTDLRSQAVRVAAMRLNKTTQEVEKSFAEDPDHWMRWFSDSSLPPVRWSDAPMTADDLPELLEAEREFLGEIPALVVVDVISDVVEREDTESYNVVFRSLHQTAKKYKTVIACLHHLRRGVAASGKVRFALDEGLFAGERPAEIILGLWQPNEEVVMVAVLKNRMGRADRSGQMAFALPSDLSRARIGTGDSVAAYRASLGMR